MRIFHLNQIECDENQAKQLYSLTDRMLEINKSMNLTAITDEKLIILRHYADSLTISRYIPQGATLIDVGCGAGFPTLPLAIFRPDLKITALDGTAKRIRYVTETASFLGLNHVVAVAGRAEEYAQKAEYREKFDIVTARAVAGMPVLCELCIPFVKINGTMIAMKSQQGKEEAMAAKRCAALCGGDDPTIISRDLTADGVNFEQRSLIFIKKIAPTPKIYPRHFSKISKKPL